MGLPWRRPGAGRWLGRVAARWVCALAAAHTRSSVSSPQRSPASLAASRPPTQTRTLTAARPLSTLSLFTLSSRSSFSLEHVHLTLTFSLPSAFRQRVSSALRPTLLSHSYATPSPLTSFAPSRPMGTADSPPARQRHSGRRSHRPNSRTRSSFRQAASSRPRRCFYVPALGGKSLRGSAAPPFLSEKIVFTRSVGCGGVRWRA